MTVPRFAEVTSTETRNYFSIFFIRINKFNFLFTIIHSHNPVITQNHREKNQILHTVIVMVPLCYQSIPVKLHFRRLSDCRKSNLYEHTPAFFFFPCFIVVRLLSSTLPVNNFPFAPKSIKFNVEFPQLSALVKYVYNTKTDEFENKHF